MIGVKFLGDVLKPELIEIVMLSLRVAGLAMAWVVPIAVAIAYLLATRQFAGKSLLNALVHLPLVLPPVATGYLLLLAFGNKGVIGEFLSQNLGIELAFRWTGAALAAGIMALPLVVRPLRVAFEATDPEIRGVAATLGAGRARIFFSVSLPLAMSGLVGGAVLGFAKALGEFGATITFVSNIPGETRTLSLAIYTFLQSPSGDGAAMTLIGFAIAISLAAILLSEWFINRIRHQHDLQGAAGSRA